MPSYYSYATGHIGDYNIGFDTDVNNWCKPGQFLFNHRVVTSTKNDNMTLDIPISVEAMHYIS